MTKSSAIALRKVRVRKTLAKRLNGRPRLSIFRSGENIYAQVIDDTKGVTVASASTLEKRPQGFAQDRCRQSRSNCRWQVGGRTRR